MIWDPKLGLWDRLLQPRSEVEILCKVGNNCKPHYEPLLGLRGNSWNVMIFASHHQDLGFLCNSVPHYKIFTAAWKAGFRAHNHHFSVPPSLHSRFYLCLENRIGAAKFQVKVHHQSHFPIFPDSALVYFLHDLQLSSIYDWLRLPVSSELLIDLQEKGGFLLDHIPWFKSHECFFKNISNLELLDELWIFLQGKSWAQKYVWQWTFKLCPASASLLSGIS